MEKRKWKRSALILGMYIGILAAETVWAEENEKTMDVVFTHDIHSYLNSYEIAVDGVNTDVGGMARLKTLLDEKRSENPDTLVLDAGDFSMGTLFHTVFAESAIEYRMLGRLGFDATTFGNHEFDFGCGELAQMMTVAADQEEELPPLLICNVDWTQDNEATKLMTEAGEKCGLADYAMFRKGDVSVAVLGVFGKNALECTPGAELTFLDPVESVKKTVKEIKEKEDPDMIVCISHSGTWSDPDQSEDEILAEAVPELDLIVSGHTHTTLPEPIIHGDTVIGSCGAYGRYTGTVSMKQKEDGRWELESYELIPMDEEVEKDETTQKVLDEFSENINQQYLGQFDLKADQVLAQNDVTFEEVVDMEYEHTEHALSDLMADAFRYEVNRIGSDEQKADVTVVSAGIVRGTYLKGNITVENVFESFSLGQGPDKIAGYPLISVYLTGDELKTAAEIDASISDFMTVARLYMSGCSFTYNPSRMILNRVTDVWLNPQVMDDSREELDSKKLYRVVTDLYTGRMLGAVTDKSYGILKIVPKFADGTAVENLEDCIVYDENGNELKAWVAIADYLQSFEKNEDGISQVPAYYTQMHGRKDAVKDSSLGAVLGKPNKYALMIYGAVAAAIAAAAVIIVLIVKLIRRIIRRRCRKVQRS